MGRDDGFVPELALVTGGRGFLARHMVLQLLEKTEYEVRIMDLGPEILFSEEEEAGILGSAMRDGRAHYVQADLRDKAVVAKVLKGVAAVFHMAAPDSSINRYQLHYDVTVTGTRNVVEACVQQGVKRLVYTSSPSIIFDGVRTIVNADESARIPEKHNDFYSAAKAQAEALVLSANGRNGLLTCAIRPSGLFGPGDKLSVPAAVTAAKAGKLKFFIGNGQNLFDWTYVENVANAHLCADIALMSNREGENAAAGKAYFITNGEPRRFWEFFVCILEGLGYPSPKYGLPVPLLMPFAYLVDWTCKLLAPLGVKHSQFTPTRVRIMSTTRTFNITRARTLLGYSPPVSLEDGMRRTIKSFSHLRNDAAAQSKSRSGPSKARFFFGNKEVANVILWNDTKQTLTVLSSLSFVAYLFFASGYSFVSLTAKFASLALAVLFIYSRLSKFGAPLPSIPSLSYFQLSEECVDHAALVMASVWNRFAEVVFSLRERGNWSLFIKVIIVLQILMYIGRCSLQAQTTLGLLALFTLPFLYDQHEENIDSFVAHASKKTDHYKNLVLAKLPNFVQKYFSHS